jgi:hypothetical protein
MFITLELYDTFMGDKIRSNVEKGISTRIYYNSSDVYSYWEVKPYIDNRNKTPPVTGEKNEFDDLAREIDTERQSYYELWSSSDYVYEIMDQILENQYRRDPSNRALYMFI